MALFARTWAHTAFPIAICSIVLALPGTANAADWSISGTLITPNGVISEGAISISGQTIADVRQGVSPPVTGAQVHVSGTILPGFIDLHNHLTWNVLPRWTPSRKFANRYQWQDTAEYDRVLVAPHNAVLDAAACQAEIYAEIKALAGGATSVVGSPVPSEEYPDNKGCAAGLVRNLDTFSDLAFTPPRLGDPCEPADGAAYQPLFDAVDNEIFPLEVPHDRLDFLRCVLKSGMLRSLVVHLSEGDPDDASAHREFSMLSAAGLLMPGLVIVHGTALRVQDFKVIHDRQAGLVWSPRSNDELYGATANISAAQQASVQIAIAPDWSPSGSAGMLQEMGYAGRRYRFLTPAQIVAMATSIPAKLARLDGQIGSLASGMVADLVVIRGGGNDPFRSVIRATPADVMLAVVGGKPLYGDPDLMGQLLPGKNLEQLTVCGAPKVVDLSESAAGARHLSLSQIQQDLDAALRRAGSMLGPIECE